MHFCPLGLICSDCFYWNQHVHCIVVIDLLVNFRGLSPLRPRIASFARFPYSCHCFIPLLSSGIGTLVINKSLLMRCNSSPVQFHWFVKKERHVYSNQSCFVHVVLSDHLLSLSTLINILKSCSFWYFLNYCPVYNWDREKERRKHNLVIICGLFAMFCFFMDYLTRIWLFDVYLWQEGGGEGGEKEHIYNHPKGGLVPPPKEGLWGVVVGEG